MDSRWRRLRDRAVALAPQIVLGAILFASLYQALCHTEAMADDAAITFAYSRQLVDHGELIHTASSERVEGFSNPTWTLICALPFLLRMDPFIYARTLGAIFLMATILLVYRTVLRLCPRSPSASFGAALLIGLTPCVCFWTMAGLETPLFALLIAALIDQVVAEEREGRPIHRSGVILALLALTRPEGILYAAPVGLYKLLLYLTSPVEGRRASLRRHGVNLLWLALPFSAYLFWRRLYFSAWLPNTFWAKVTAHPLLPTEELNEPRGVRYVRGFFELNNLWPLVYASPAALLVRRRWAEAIFLVALALAHLGFVLGVDGDWMGDFRFFAMTMPIYAVIFGLSLQGAADLLGRLGEWLRHRRIGVVVGRLVAAGLLIAFLATSLWPTLTEYSRAGWVSMELVRRQGVGLEMIARRLGLHQALIAVPDVGGSAVATNVRVLDTAGLVDPVISRFKSRADRVRRYIFEEARPDFYQHHSHWGRYYNLPEHFEFRRDYAALPRGLTKRMSLLGDDFVRREHLLAHQNEVGHRVDFDLGHGLWLRGYDSPVRTRGQVLFQLYVELVGDRLGDSDWVEVRLRPEPEGRHPSLMVELNSLPPDIFEPGRLIRLRFSANVGAVEAIQIQGVEGQRLSPWWPVTPERAGHQRGASLEGLVLFPRTQLVCAFPPLRGGLIAMGRRQRFDGCQPRYRATEVDGQVVALRARSERALDLGLVEAAILLLDRADLLEPTSRLTRRAARRAAEHTYRAAQEASGRGELPRAQSLATAALRAEPLLSRARALDIDLVSRGFRYFPDQRERLEVALDRLRRGSPQAPAVCETLEAAIAAERPLDGLRAIEGLRPELLRDPTVARLEARAALAVGLCERAAGALEAAGGARSCEDRLLSWQAAALCGQRAARPDCAPPAPPASMVRSLFEFDDDGMEGWELSIPTVEPEELPLYYTSGFSGSGLLQTHWVEGGSQAAFRARSPEFEIDQEALSLQVGGGAEADGVRVVLLVDGREVRRGAGQRDQHLRRLTWDVSELIGRRAQLEVIDEGGPGDWGRLLVDHVRSHPLSLFDADRAPVAPPPPPRGR